jgi:hypothetical protein
MEYSIPRRGLISSLILLIAVAVLPMVAAPARAAETSPPDWIFPIVGTDGVDFGYRDTFGACRGTGCSRSHHGVDIGTYGVKGVPVVAAADGRVKYVNWSWTADDLNPDRCCTIAIMHADGWETWYIHLNNDTPGTDDGLAWGIAEGIVPGVEVKAGQLIGWVGDSGNAENTSPHLHWEVHIDGVVVNPTPHADAATRIAAAGISEVAPACIDGAVCDSIASVDAGGIWSLWDQIEWPATKASFYYGNPGDIPFMGDWDADGIETPGLFRQSDGYVYVRHTNTQGNADITFFFGNPADVPLVGDFDGDGRDSVSIWRPSQARVYIIDELGEDGKGLGAANYFFELGDGSLQPFVGDFDGDGVDTIGFYDPSEGLVHLRNSNSAGPADVSFRYGNAGDRILVGDWDGDGDDTVGRYAQSAGHLYLNFTNTSEPADWNGYVGYSPYLVTAGRSG